MVSLELSPRAPDMNLFLATPPPPLHLFTFLVILSSSVAARQITVRSGGSHNPANHLGYTSSTDQSAFRVAFPPLRVRKVIISRQITGASASEEDALSLGDRFFSRWESLSTTSPSLVVGGNGGGILTIHHSTLRANSTGAGGARGAIGNDGVLHLTNSVLARNGTAAGVPDGAAGRGGARFPIAESCHSQALLSPSIKRVWAAWVVVVTAVRTIRTA